jgi:site-specific recombinase XerD
LWESVHSELKRLGYRRNTRRLYRHVLRSVAKFVRVGPAQVRENALQNYLVWQARRGATASWMTSNITVLRMVFDKLGGKTLTRHMTTPRRPWPLPQVITVESVRRLLAAAPTLRDQLLLGLLYGCGLKVGELCRLQWRNIEKCADGDRLRLRVSLTREIPIPADLAPVLREGLTRCGPNDYVFTGARVGRPLSDRMVAWILQQAVKTARLDVPVDGMVLRHSYAVHCLEAGLTIRDVQERLGHRQVKTTLVYLRLLHPKVTSPLDTLDEKVKRQNADCKTVEASATMAADSDSLSPRERTGVRGDPASSTLFPAPLTTDNLNLPFAPDPGTATTAALRFYAALRTRVVNGFLALKRAIRSTA